MYTTGQVIGTIHSIALSYANPCNLIAPVKWGYRGIQAIQAASGSLNAYKNYQSGNFFSAAFDLVGVAANFRQLLRACFTGDTQVRTRNGFVRFDRLQVKDEVLSAPDYDPNAAVEYREIEAVFRTVARIWHLRAKGHLICTTAEHPFYVQGKGWVAASLLQPGDLLRSNDGQFVPVDEIHDAGYEETVYNCRVADFHTYFVGSSEWGFSVWAHNTSCDARILRKNLDPTGTIAGVGDQAAHIVPTGAFSRRIAAVRDAIKDAQAAVASLKLPDGLNNAANGFFATVGHNGTHTNAYFLELGRLMRNAMKDGNVADVLANIKALGGKII